MPARYDWLGFIDSDELKKREKKCNNAKKTFLIINERWASAIKFYEEKGCKLKIECVCCGTDPQYKDIACSGVIGKHSEVVGKEITYKAAICYDRATDYAQTMAHEIMHHFDRCRNTDIIDCGSKKKYTKTCMCANELCEEMRAFRIENACKDRPSCMDKVIKAGYLKWNSCKNVEASQITEIKELLLSQCSLTIGMPPPPDWPVM